MKSFMIFGQKVKLYFKDITGSQLCGYYEPTKKEIVVHNKLDKKLMDVTLIHEFIHAHFDRMGYRQVVSVDIEELIADQLAVSICDNFNLKLK